jgi:H/ACA ribonucleoprotein complex subunit 4|nr:hypothetical protein [Candidatus Hecatella orcuttiae]
MKRTPLPWEPSRELKVKDEATTDKKYGKPPEKRELTEHLRFGYVNLDKPPGPSSHEVTAWVKRVLGVKHAGHGGTLEADAAGEIPVSQACFPSPWRRLPKLSKPSWLGERNTSAS